MIRTFSLVVLLGAATAACNGSSPTTPTSVPAPLTAPVSDALQATIRDEFRAETIYEGVVADFGQVQPFTNVLTAETRHSASLAGLFQSRGLAVPANPWTPSTVPHFATVAAACAGGVAAERENVALYDRYLGLELPADVRRVFENNRSASLVNHLPAFERCQ